MALPYLPLYVADYLGDTMHLSLEQHGAYMKLLMCMWRSGGRLPNDRTQIARILSITPVRWDKISEEVLAFFETDGTSFWSPRLITELEKSEVFVEKQRAAGVASGEAKSRKRLSQAPTDAEPTISITNTIDLFEDSIPQESRLSAKEACEQIWEGTPMASRKRSSKGHLAKALEAARARRKNLAVIVQAVASYFADPDKAKEDHRYAKGVHRVVQDDYWETWAQADGVEHMSTAFSARQMRSWMQDWTQNRGCTWDYAFRGPKPDEPGCRIPLEIMAEFGFTPPKGAVG